MHLIAEFISHYHQSENSFRNEKLQYGFSRTDISVNAVSLTGSPKTKSSGYRRKDSVSNASIYK
jgi:hypothetical protein